jgi:hypothetical protein
MEDVMLHGDPDYSAVGCPCMVGDRCLQVQRTRLAATCELIVNEPIMTK